MERTGKALNIILQETGLHFKKDKELNKEEVKENNPDNQTKINIKNKDIKKELTKETSKENTQPNNFNNNNTNNKQLEFYLKENKIPALDIFKESEKQISKGDTIRYLRNNKENNIINSHTAKVININKQTKEITLEESKEKINKDNKINKENIIKQDKDQTNIKTLKLDNPILKHIDYAYASTTYSAQGKTSQNVIAVLEANKPLTSKQAFYVEISRAKESASLVVDNIKEVQKTLESNTGVKLSALDIIKQQDLSKQTHINSKAIELETSKENTEQKSITNHINNINKEQDINSQTTSNTKEQTLAKEDSSQTKTIMRDLEV